MSILKLKRKEGEPEKTHGELLLQPEYCEPQSQFDSLMRDLLHRIIENEHAITLDLTDCVQPEKSQRVPGTIKWRYGAWTGDERLRNSGEEVPFDKITKLEITLWFEPELITEAENA